VRANMGLGALVAFIEVTAPATSAADKVRRFIIMIRPPC
jgi:hypothetical protein